MNAPNDSTAEQPCSESSQLSEPMPLPASSSRASGNYTAYNPTAIWWPHPSAFDDLTVEETENGFEFSAPDGTEAAEWLAYFSETPERHAVFEEALQDALTSFINHLNNGQGERLSDQQTADYPCGEENVAGTV
jgi:hypothetical protein